MSYRLHYSNTSKNQIRVLHPWIKPLVKRHIENLREQPFSGKALERDLAGFYSLRAKRFQVIYEINQTEKIIQIHYVGYRRDIYELFRKLMADEQ
jgi:mRNA-degrading endonuclease RelE of RelBE toxin-antitoxin system